MLQVLCLLDQGFGSRDKHLRVITYRVRLLIDQGKICDVSNEFGWKVNYSLQSTAFIVQMQGLDAHEFPRVARDDLKYDMRRLDLFKFQQSCFGQKLDQRS